MYGSRVPAYMTHAGTQIQALTDLGERPPAAAVDCRGKLFLEDVRKKIYAFGGFYDSFLFLSFHLLDLGFCPVYCHLYIARLCSD